MCKIKLNNHSIITQDCITRYIIVNVSTYVKLSFFDSVSFFYTIYMFRKDFKIRFDRESNILSYLAYINVQYYELSTLIKLTFTLTFFF